ncbi:hypothetical protein C8J57DRAFT_1520493 [Mycena rebaudengoi]|nr:hypothetical protein C8J57DRAFT_1520493 [Mycena rebaudengoi]
MESITNSTIFGQRSSTDAGSTDELKLSSFTDIAVTIPSTVPDAERLLHFVRSHRDVCEMEKNLVVKRLHQTLLYLQLLRDEIDKAGSKLSAADDDLVKFEHLLPHIKGSIGFVFTDGDLKEVCEIIFANKVAAPAHPGAFAPKDVTVPTGNTTAHPPP